MPQVIQRRRLLPEFGKVLVRIGQEVQPMDVVAETMLPSGMVLVDVAKGLGCQIAVAEEHINVKMGSMVSVGEILAYNDFLFIKRSILSPCNGKVKWIECGKIWIEEVGVDYKLLAAYAGKIVNNIWGRGVIIETNGTLCCGVWGNQKMGYGRLRYFPEQSTKKLCAADITKDMRSEVLVAQYCDSVHVFNRAVEVSLCGFVFASLPSGMLPFLENLNIPILILEGFGNYQMNKLAMDFFSSNEGKEVVINAQHKIKTGQRGEVFVFEEPGDVIDMQAAAKENIDNFEPYQLKAGQKVKIILTGYHGEIGQIEKIYPSIQKYPNGVCSLSAEVAITEKEHVIVPLDNLEIISI